MIEFGNPITVTPDLVDQFKQGGDPKRDACGKLLNTIHGALKSVTVNAGSYETLMVSQKGERKKRHKDMVVLY